MSLPQTGQAIRGRRTRWAWEYEGVVDYIYPVDDEPVIALTDGTYVVPSLGDTWEAA